MHTSSSIQTVLSVSELHRINACALADFTAGREFHPALKTSCSVVGNIIADRVQNARAFFKNRAVVYCWKQKGGGRDGLRVFRPPAGEAAVGRR